LQISESSTDVSSNANQIETEELKTRLGTIEITIDDINAKLKARDGRVREKRQAINTGVVDFSQSTKYVNLEKETKQLADEYKALQARGKELEEACRGLDDLQEKISGTAMAIDQFPRIRSEKEAKTHELKRDISGLQAQKDTAEIELQMTKTALSSVETQLLDPLTKEENRSCNTKRDEEKERFLAAKKKIERDAESKLNDMLRY
jgi:chromosome segregation ATPase